MSLSDIGPLSNGTFRPTDADVDPDDTDTFPAPAPEVRDTSALAAFAGLDPNGTWRLFVVDDQNDDGGSIASWELTLVVKVKNTKR